MEIVSYDIVIHFHCSPSNPTYSTRSALFGMSSLENRRKTFSIIFIRCLIYNHIQCPKLLDALCFYSSEPKGDLKFCRIQFTQNEKNHNCCKIRNVFVDKLDIFKTTDRHHCKFKIVMIINQKS